MFITPKNIYISYINLDIKHIHVHPSGIRWFLLATVSFIPPCSSKSTHGMELPCCLLQLKAIKMAVSPALPTKST